MGTVHLQFQRLLRPILFAMAMILSLSASACYVNITASNGNASSATLCSGTTLTFTGVITQASYQVNYYWKKNGVTLTGTGSTGSFGSNPPSTVAGNGTFTIDIPGLVTGDQITCYITEPYNNNYSYTSNTITLTVSNQAPQTSGFNGTSIASGNTIWFNSAISVTGSATYPMTIYYTGQTITSSAFSISVPDAELILDASYSVATTTYNGSMWVTTAPPNQSGNYFLAGYAYTVPSTISTSPNVTWNGNFLCSQSGVSVNWQWAAAVYTTFNSNFASLGVKGSDCSSCSVYSNSDHAGTPESYKSYVIGGARGGGGSNYTGSYSSTGSVTPCVGVTPSVTISGTSSICSGASVTFTATPTNGGTAPTYQWYKNSAAISGATASTYTTTGLANSDVVYCIMTSNAAGASPTTATSNSITETVTASVTPSVTVTNNSTSNTICAGGSITFTASAINGGSGTTYQWYNNGAAISGATNSTYTTTTLASGNSITCTITSNATCASPTTATSSPTVITVNPTVVPSVSITPTTTTVCAGTSVAFAATASNATSYQWYLNGSAVSGATNSTYTVSSPTNGNTVYCVVTSTATCASPTTATSNTATITVTPTVTPSVSVTNNSTGNAICSGSSITFTASTTNGGGSTTYQWKNNGTTISGATSSAYTTTTLASGNSITCTITSNATCASPTTATSSPTVITVNPTVVPSVSITPTATTVCTGTSVMFTATASNATSYQWYLNSSAVSGATSSTYTVSSPSNGNTVYCVVTSTATCASPTTATSNTATITVTPTVVPSVSITPTATTVCAGTPVTFTASATNASSYQWYLNGTLVSGATGNTYTVSSPATGNTVYCVVTSNATCASPTTATSNTATITVTPTVVPSVSITPTATTVCTGTSVMFTATATNATSYQWYLNGSAVSGATGNTYTEASPTNGNTVYCVVTSSATCASPTTATSNTATITVTPTVVPSVSITPTATTVCAGTSVAFAATASNATSYQWYLNGSAVSGATSSTYTVSSPSNGNTVYCVVTSTATCASPTTATSNTATITVTPTVVPSVSITPTATTVCAGTPVTFTASATNASSYQWYLNGTLVSGATGNTYTVSSPATGNTVYCVVTSNATCASPTTATSNTATITVTPTVVPSVSITPTATTVCTGTSVMFTATASNATSYQWYLNGSAVSGATGNTYTVASPTNGNTVYCVVTSSATCASPTTATSNTATITVTPSVVPSVSITPTATTVCTGTSVTFTATASNATSYQWYLNGSAVSGATGNTYTVASPTNGNTVYCVVTSTATCASPATATSNTATITVTPSVVPSVSITPANATVCAGTPVTFTASASNATSYQWYLNSSAVSGATGTTYTVSSPTNGNTVYCVVTSTATCASPATATSNTSTITVTPSVTPSVSIAANPGNNTCANTSVTFTATANNVASYQWYKNGSAVSGATGATYTDAALTNGNTIYCVITSSTSCASPTSANSNTITMNVNGTATQPGAFTTFTSTVYDGQGNVIYTVPAVSGTTYTWSYSGTGATIINNGNSATVSFSPTATSGTISVTATTSACGTASAPQTMPVTVKPYLTWNCSTNNDWNNPANWDGGFVPYSTISVLIPSTASCQPNVCSGSASVYNMTVNSGATVNICCNYNVTVNNGFTINGSILGCGTVIVTGTTCQPIYGNGRVDNFELNNTCGGIINPGDTLHVGNTYIPTNGVLTINGELELLSDSTHTATVLTHPGVCANYINGDVICDKYIHGGRRAFRFFGHPFTTDIPLSQVEPYIDITGQGGAANGFTPTATNNPSAFWYNTITGNGSMVNDSTGWTAYTNTNGVGANAWNQYEGMRLFIRGGKGDGLCACNTNDNPVVVKLHGPINECDQVVTLAANNNVGFNFISNPYPSDIDMSQTTRGNNIGANFCVWDPNQGLVGAYVEQPWSMSYILPSMSSFFTTCTSNTGNTLTFHEGQKTASAPTGNLFKTTGTNEMLQLHVLSNNDSLSWDRLLLFFNDQAQAGADAADGTKLSNPDLSFYTFSADNSQLSVDQRPYVNGQVIKLGLTTDVNQAYSIRVDDYNVPAGGSLYLHDKYLNQTQLLSQGFHYNFSVTSNVASQGDNRFELNVVGNTGVANVAGASELKVDVYPNPVTDNATISYQAPQKGNTVVTITNLLGQQVYADQMGQQQSGKVSLPLNKLPGGVYMVTFKCGDLSVTNRLVKQ